MLYQFTVIIERDPESGWLVGSVAELPGCYTEAPTLAQLESNMREAIHVYLETVAEQVTLCFFPTFVGQKFPNPLLGPIFTNHLDFPHDVVV